MLDERNIYFLFFCLFFSCFFYSSYTESVKSEKGAFKGKLTEDEAAEVGKVRKKIN